MTLDDLLRLLPDPRKSGNEYTDFCPVHEPPGLKHKTRSLNVRQRGDNIVLKCRSQGCSTREICEALGVDPRELWTKLPGRIVKTYPYVDAENRLLYQKTRHEPGEDGKKKSFRLWTPDAARVSGWRSGLNGVPRVLYHLPQVLKSDLIFLPEGEKDCEYLESLDLPGTAATTNSGGVAGWRDEDAEILRDKIVIVFADNDAAGKKLVEHKARSLAGIAAVVKIVRPPPEFRDVEHWHPSKKDLLAAIDAAPEWQAPPEPEIEIPEAIQKPAEFVQPDLPDTCLQGRLGEICQRRLGNLPLAYSWPALLVAGASKMDERAPDVQSNLYGCLVGGVHTGKTQGGDTAIRVLGIERPQLMDAFIGSGEALARECAKAAGNPRLFAPDELGHMLEKMRIERSGFSFLITRAFDRTQFYNFMGKKESRDFNCDLSILGGVVEERFQELFNFSTTAGVYDRFLYGLCPGNFNFSYRPFSGSPGKISLHAVQIDPEMWEWRDEFLKRNPAVNPRVIQLAIRAAVICAAFDDVHVLGIARMGPHIELARYQSRIREVLKPNPGENFEGQVAHKILDYLAQHPGWNKRRDVYRAIHATDKGPSIFERALDVLRRNGLLAKKRERKAIMLKLAGPNEEVDED